MLQESCHIYRVITQRILLWMFTFVLLSFMTTEVLAVPADQEKSDGATVDEHLGDQINLKNEVLDHFGQKVFLENFIPGDKPVVFTLNYYSCAALCSVQLNAVLQGYKDMDWVPGQEFHAVTLSIDPEETPKLAANKRDAYLQDLNKEKANWNFLVAEQSVITDIADQFGYRYRYDEETKQYAHPAVIMILSPDGTISRYLYGLSYSARDLKFALIEASQGKIGTTVDRVILSCFMYDNTTGKYTASAFGLMRLAGVITMFFLGVMVTYLWRRESRISRSK